MKIIVTGGTGFLGRHVVKKLLDGGHVVRVLARRGSERRRLSEGSDGNLTAVEIVPGDLRDTASLDRAVSGMEAVCHCAAHMETSSPWRDFEEVTIRGTERLLEAACRHSVGRFLHVSSLGIFGTGSGTITEDSPLDDGLESRGAYTRSKAEAERVVWEYHRERNLPVTVIRPGLLYGPGKSPVVARVSFSIGSKLRVAIGLSQQRLPLAYVEDVADAIHLALNNDRAIGKAYNVVDDGILQKEYLALLRRAKLTRTRTILISPEPIYPLLSMLERSCRWLRIRPPVSRHQFERALASIHYDTTRARRDLGWSPRVHVADGLRRIRAASGGPLVS
ncbi:MAG TPA: NAD(P)-dependent oxidoreductase [Candidatus Eisenbacteria bacterium]|nr:NAD(P)-dependent oxidoreductase [Candidatus Eisenbacteria bacterium]